MTPTLGKREAQVIGCWCLYLPAAVLASGAAAGLYHVGVWAGGSTVPGVLAGVASAALALVALGAWLAVLGVGLASLAPRRAASRPTPAPPAPRPPREPDPPEPPTRRPPPLQLDAGPPS